MRGERYCVIDVETTGFSPVADRVVEIGCAEIEGDQIVARWSTLVNPGRAIPAEATAIHGITDAMVARAPSLKSALKYARRLGPMRLARALFPEAPNHKNQDAPAVPRHRRSSR